MLSRRFRVRRRVRRIGRDRGQDYELGLQCHSFQSLKYPRNLVTYNRTERQALTDPMVCWPHLAEMCSLELEYTCLLSSHSSTAIRTVQPLIASPKQNTRSGHEEDWTGIGL